MPKSIQARLKDRRPYRPTLQKTAGQRQHQQDTSRYYGEDWRRLRAAHLADHPACVVCGKVSKSNNVDHIVPHKGDDALRLDPRNLQTLCHSHSSRKTAKHDGGFGNEVK